MYIYIYKYICIYMYICIYTYISIPYLVEQHYKGNSSHLFCWISYSELLWYVIEQMLFEAFGKRWSNIYVV